MQKIISYQVNDSNRYEELIHTYTQISYILMGICYIW